MKYLGLLFILTITTVISYGQRTISGTVTSAVDGKPVGGVKITLLEEKIDNTRNDIVFVGTKIKTKTNEKGEYSLTVPDTWRNVLRFKKSPYSTTHIKLNDRTDFDLSMTLTVRQADK
jgi:hypothetical protein